MGRKSLNKHNNRYLEVRQELNLTREEAADLLTCISEDRLEKIENNRACIHPEEVLVLSEKYKTPSLCNHYCSNECPIGKKYVPTLEISDLKEMTFDMMMSLEKIIKDKDKFMELVADGKITKEELSDFLLIKSNLTDLSKTINTMNLWIDNEIAKGKYNS